MTKKTFNSAKSKYTRWATNNPRGAKYLKYGLVLYIVLSIGYAVGAGSEQEVRVEEKLVTETNTVEVVKSPRECSELVELDNQILRQVGSYFDVTGVVASQGDLVGYFEVASEEADKITELVTENTDRRNALIADCLNQ